MTTKTSKKKVLFVATVDSHIELFHLPFLKYFKDNDFEVHVATNSNKPIKYCDKKIQLPIARSPFKPSNLRAIKQLRKIIDREHYNIIHCHTPMGSVVARLAAKNARKSGTRVIYTAHGFHFYKGAPLLNWLLFYPVEKYLAKYTDTLITINQEDYTRAKKKFGKRCHDIQYGPGVGVDPKKFETRLTTKEKNALRSSLGLKVDDVVLICIGRLDKNKNQGFLIKTLSQLGKNYHLLLVGPDELNGKYQKLAKKLNLENRVHFLGFRSDIPELLQISNLAVSASKREGLPVNLIESAFASLPIVATDCRGNRDICLATNSPISPQNNISAFVKNILKFPTRHTNIRTLSAFSSTTVNAKMFRIYQKKKRILHILASNSFSGAENVACTIIEKLSNDYDFAYCSPYGSIESVLRERKIKYFGINKFNHKNLKKIINLYRPNIIHAHDYRASLLASLFHCNAIIISHIHQNNPKLRQKNIYSWIFKHRAKRFSKIIWVSESAFKDYYYSRRLKPNSVVLPNIVDSEKVIKNSKINPPKEHYDIIFLGRLVPPKNPKRFIRISSELAKLNKHIRIAIVGDGEQRDTIKQMIIDNDLQNNIKMYGHVENPYPILANSKILVMTSVFEGTPMADLEAQCLGIPIVSTPTDGLRKIIRNGVNGFLAESDKDIFSKILKILNKENYETFSKKAIEHFRKANNLNAYLDRIMTSYGN